MDGEKEVSDYGQDSQERQPEGYTWSRERLKRKQTSRPEDAWPDKWNLMSDAAKKKAKQR